MSAEFKEHAVVLEVPGAKHKRQMLVFDDLDFLTFHLRSLKIQGLPHQVLEVYEGREEIRARLNESNGLIQFLKYIPKPQPDTQAS